jgi:hypothetical protein
LERVLGNLTDLDTELGRLDELLEYYDDLIENSELMLELYENTYETKTTEIKPKGFTETAGWYQNIKGQLFHFDGVIWDEVPEEKLEKLEYLG